MRSAIFTKRTQPATHGAKIIVTDGADHKKTYSLDQIGNEFFKKYRRYGNPAELDGFAAVKFAKEVYSSPEGTLIQAGMEGGYVHIFLDKHNRRFKV